MLTYSEALQRLLTQVPESQFDEVPLAHCLGLVLAERVEADLDLPPFDKSFMDGFALRSSDLKPGVTRLRITGVAAAGGGMPPEIQPGQAVQIMTGAPLPAGADAVQMVEKTRRQGEWIEILEPVETGTNVAPLGSEVRRGQTVLEAGRVIGPAEIAVLATFGRSKVKVRKRLSAAIVSTGDELVAVEERPAFSQIRNSNACMLEAQCRRVGVEAAILPPVKDDPKQIRDVIRRGLKSDLLILTGGVSMGEYDYVHGELAREGIEIFFHKAAIKPGKPLIVGRAEDRMVFGLPGNPVSAFVTFEVFVRPALLKWMGCPDYSLPEIKARLLESTRHKTGRLFFKPACTTLRKGRFVTRPLDTKGSADIVGFSGANSLLLIPADRPGLEKGEQVDVMLLSI